jgi:hypothetical protein
MPYEVQLKNGEIVQVQDLAVDGSNWTTYREDLIYVATLEGVVGQFDGTDAPPVAGTKAYQAWSRRNSQAKLLIVCTLPDDLLIDFHIIQTAQEIFTRLECSFSKSTNAIATEAIQPIPTPTLPFPD